MINSMTGYGGAAYRSDNADYALEIKTVNNRYCKTIIRLPEGLAFLEKDIEKLLRQNIYRGTVTYVLHLKTAGANAMFDINQEVLQECVRKLSEISRNEETKCDIDLSQLLLLPGIVQPAQPDEQQAKQNREVVLDITNQALQKLNEMRSQEGAALAADLASHCDAIEKLLEQIEKRCPLVIQEYEEKLKNRVDSLLAAVQLELNRETLAREIAIFAERCDISEEIARLDSHIEQFTQSLNENGQVGRKLDFIVQEMLREANTIASKVANIETARCIVDIKCHIDALKEQVQNVE